MPVYLPPISRRRFLKHSAAAVAALSLGQGCLSSKGNSHSVALLSDIHIDADANVADRGANMTKNLRTVVGEVAAWPQPPEAVFINGDLAHQNGKADDYVAVVNLLRPVREKGLPIHLGLGNHDDRENFWNTLSESKTEPADLPGRQATILETPEANWFILDSLIHTLTTPGQLGEAQRVWLAAALDARADKPALILVHHQPVAPPPGLQDAAELFAILRPRRQVKAWFFGHTHRWNVSQDESGIHLINLPPTAYLFEAGHSNGWVHATVLSDRATLELRCLDRTRPDHGQQVELLWRT
jgi:3',5'-cyclic AMP phosphodiesterase CpdA